jgi:hypothetical protein
MAAPLLVGEKANAFFDQWGAFEKPTCKTVHQCLGAIVQGVTSQAITL